MNWFCWHDWGNWVYGGEVMNITRQTVIGSWQYRICKKCGFRKERIG